MRIEMKHEAELEKRKGQTWKTILAIIWLALSFFGCYLLAGWLFEEGHLSMGTIYGSLMVPQSISENMVRIGTAFVIFLLLQFVVLILLAVVSPSAKRKTGVPRVDTDDPDPYEKSSYHQH
ncbi:MAG: hypothetical protein ACK2T3_06655 [Candidatus Promineifilaceae bacterium]